MRTRRSWRNQNILWRELGDVRPQVKHQDVMRTDAEIDAMPFWSKAAKAAEKRKMRALRMRTVQQKEDENGL